MTLQRSEISAAICAELADILVDRPDHGDIVATARVIEDLDLDSIDFVTLLVWCEAEYGVTLIDGAIDWTGVRTIDALAGLVVAADAGVVTGADAPC